MRVLRHKEVTQIAKKKKKIPAKHCQPFKCGSNGEREVSSTENSVSLNPAKAYSYKYKYCLLISLIDKLSYFEKLANNFFKKSHIKIVQIQSLYSLMNFYTVKLGIQNRKCGASH